LQRFLNVNLHRRNSSTLHEFKAQTTRYFARCTGPMRRPPYKGLRSKFRRSALLRPRGSPSRVLKKGGEICTL
jgi:hypothetical protein